MKKLLITLILLLYIAPPTIRMIQYEYIISFPWTKEDDQWITVEGKWCTVEEVFQEAYETMIILGITPECIIFDVHPYNRDDWFKMWDLSEDLFQAL